MALTYTTYIAQISNIMAVQSSTTQFQTMAPGMIDYAEQRLYRELDLLSTVVTDQTGTLTSGSRNFTLPTTSNGKFITVQNINLLTPVSATFTTGTRVPLAPIDKSYLDNVWGSSTGSAVPKNFAMIDQWNIIVGPWPNAAYKVEVIGTIRPNPLSVSNTTTFLTTYLPDLFIAASMIFASGYQRDFGAQADNPQQAQSWEAQYENLIKSAGMEEIRKKWSGPGWSSFSTVANPPNR